MGIRTAECQGGSLLREYYGRRIILPGMNGAGGVGGAYVAAAAVPVNGTPMTLTQPRMHVPHCITLGYSSTLASSFLITGYNQFGDVVSETVANAGGGALVAQSLWAYEYLLSVVPITGAWAAITIEIGYNAVLQTGKFGLPFKVDNATDVAAVSMGVSVLSNPAVDVDHSTVAMPALGNFGATTGATVVIHLTPASKVIDANGEHVTPGACYKY